MTETAPIWPHERPPCTSIAAAVQGETARWNVPAMTAAVLHDGQRDSAAAGVTNLDFPVPIRPDTRFQVGSISKVFTATAIMTLVDEGRVDLDAPVTTWVPDLRIARRTIEHEGQFSSERPEDDPPVEMDAWPTGDGVYRVLEGPYRDSPIEFFDTRLFAGEGDAPETRRVMRTGGRLAERR